MADATSNLNIVLQVKDQATSQIEGFKKTLNDLQPQFQAVAQVGAAGFAAIAGVAYASLSAADEAAHMQAQLGAVLKSTAGIAGVTRDAAISLSKALEAQTTYSDEAILSAENMLLTFTNIKSNVFPEVTKTVLDMSTALGTDLKESSIQVGKALQDPILGITALRRVGVNFSEANKETIKTMVESGNLLGAQKFILHELATEFGGSATAAAATFGGQMKQLSNSVNNLAEEIGVALAPTLLSLVQMVKPIIEHLIQWAQAHPELIKNLIILGGIVTAVLTAIGTLGLIIPSVVTGFLFLISPIGLVSLAISTLIGLAALLILNWDYVRDNFLAVWQIMKANAQASVTAISAVILNNWNALKDNIKLIWDSVSSATQGVWNDIATFFTATWESIKATFKAAYDYIMNLLQPLINAVNSVGGSVRSVLSSVGGGISSAVSAVGRVIGVHDAVITPSGQVIQTDPADYLIATKNPSSLGGGVTVNIYGDVTGNELVEKVKQALMQNLRLDTRFAI